MKVLLAILLLAAVAQADQVNIGTSATITVTRFDTGLTETYYSQGFDSLDLPASNPVTIQVTQAFAPSVPTSEVPEPSTFALLITGAVMLWRKEAQ